ncbi:CAP domain-containing protein [Chitinophaga lutea]
MLSLNRSIFIASIVLFAAACQKDNSVSPVTPPTTGGDDNGTVVVIENNINRQLLLQLVNDVRAKGCNCGSTAMPPVAPLAWNTLLELAAATHSKDMAQKKYFAHNSPNGITPQARIKSAGYDYSWSGENIASGPSKESEVISGWLQSEGHCKNIMNANYKEMGVGRANNLWTQVFGAQPGK